jgi:hypothetical protein
MLLLFRRRRITILWDLLGIRPGTENIHHHMVLLEIREEGIF